MDVKKFKIELTRIKPNLSNIIENGFSEEYSKKMIINNFVLTERKKTIKTKSSIEDFCKNYELEYFNVRNISFSDILRYIEGYLIVANVDGGYIGLDEATGVFYNIWADEIENIYNVFCENEKQFFEILLIVAEYNSKVISGKIKFSNDESREEYIEQCENIYPLGSYEDLF